MSAHSQMLTSDKTQPCSAGKGPRYILRVWSLWCIMKETLWGWWSDKSHIECLWFMPICRHTHTHTHTHTHRDSTPQEAFRGHTAFSGFQRSSRESKDRLDHLKRRSANSSPLPGVGRSLKIVREKIVVWHVCLIVNSIWSILFGVEQIERYLLSRTQRRRTRSGPSYITYWSARSWRSGSFQYLLIMCYLFWKKGCVCRSF